MQKKTLVGVKQIGKNMQLSSTYSITPKTAILAIFTSTQTQNSGIPNCNLQKGGNIHYIVSQLNYETQSLKIAEMYI